MSAGAIRKMNAGGAISSLVEIWQAQTYWPIKGWAAPLSGSPHYSCLLLSCGVADAFPNDLLPPVGWKWVEDWSLDTSSPYGSSDVEGWFYAPSFDRLHDQMRNACASGLAATTCTVRKRRWVRSITCISSDLQAKIRARADQIVQMRVNVELSMKNKEACLKHLSTYEEERVAAFAQSLHMATQQTLNTLSILKDISSKMKLVKQYVSDRALMEREHSMRLDKLALKYLPLESALAADGSLTPSAESAKLHGGDDLVAQLAKSLTSPPRAVQGGADPERSSQCTASADMFFGKIVSTTRAQAESLEEYSRNILPLLSEMDALQAEIQEVLKDARVRFRKNSDICRLSEAAILNFHASVQYAFTSVTQGALREVGLLTEELTCLRGGLPYHPIIFDRIASGDLGSVVEIGPTFMSGASAPSSGQSGAGPGGVHMMTAAVKKTIKLGAQSPAPEATPGGPTAFSSNHEDFWLSTQRYKVSVRDAQEALAVLVSEHMDIDLQQQIISNRAYSLLARLAALYAQEEVVLYETLRAIYRREMKGLVADIKALGLPHTSLLSPFEKLNPQGEGAQPPPEYHDFVNAKGVFAFTALYRTPLPAGPGVVKSGYLYCVPSAELRAVMQASQASATSSSFEYVISASPTRAASNARLDWKEVYVVCTSDGFVHVLLEKICDIPDRSFFLKHCVWRELQPSTPPLLHHALELSSSPKHLSTAQEPGPAGSPSKRRGSKGGGLQGLVFRAADGSSLATWTQLFHSLSSCPVVSDSLLDAKSQEAMLDSLPILKGETAQIDLNLSMDYLESLGVDLDVDLAPGRRRGKKGQYVPGDDVAGSGDSDTSSDYGEVEGSPEAAGTGPSDSALRHLHGEGFSDDESDYPVSAATTPYTPHHRAAPLSPDEDLAESASPKTPLAEADESRDAQLAPRRVERRSGAPMAAAAADQELTPPPLRSARKLSTQFVASKYEKRDAGSWIMKAQEGTGSRLTSVGNLPVADIKPVQIIPNANKSMPLAKRHSQMIKQYEQGLQSEKEKTSLKVMETRGQRLKDFGIDEIVGAVPSEDAAEPEPAPAEEAEDALSALPPTVTKSARSLGVKRLSKMFDAKDGREVVPDSTTPTA